MIRRTIEANITKRLHKGKAILILGPRQTGKTTLIRKLFEPYGNSVIWLSGDNASNREQLANIDEKNLKQLIGKHRYLIIDEAQRVSNIGLVLKIIVDQIPTVQVVATGSSAFELAESINEPLTGRKFEYQLFPLSFAEIAAHSDQFDEISNLENRMIYGRYPEVVTSIGEEKDLLSLLSDSYLYKDLLAYDKMKKPALITALLKALALQIGNQVSYNELARTIGADKGTVERYIDLLEKVFIVFKLNTLSRNVRNELKKSRKIYFYDNGIRNAIIGNYAPLSTRMDKGALWENYLISERWKKLKYAQFYGQRYFWRTTQQQEIDYLEEVDGGIEAYEFKWGSGKKPKFSLTFLNAYNVRSKEVITPRNYHQWLSD